MTQDDRIVILPDRPADWGELGWAMLVGLLLGVFVGWIAFGPTDAEAGGPTAITWEQGQDCAVTTGWELLQAPVTTAQPNPPVGSATLGVSIPNTGTPPCGLNMTKTVTLNGIGTTRFWLRAVAVAGKSGESNHVDASLPFAKPGLTSVVP